MLAVLLLEIDVEELFEEMKRRGYRTYSEQQALAEEMYGSGNNTGSASYGWLGDCFSFLHLYAVLSLP